MDNEPLIALISFGDSREDMFERRRCIFEREIGAVEQWLSLSCNIAYKFEVNNQEAVYEAVSSLRLKNVDVAILYLPIWSFPSLVVSCAKLLNNLPVLLLANSKKETSSIGGMLGAAGGLDMVGIPHQRVVYNGPTDGLALQKVNAFCKAAATFRRLQGKKFGCFGGRSLGIYTTTASLPVWQKLFGVDIEHLDQFMILQEANKVQEEEVDAYFSWFLRNVGQILNDNIPQWQDALKRQIRSYIATRRLIEQYGLDFVGIKCQRELSDNYVIQCLKNVAMLNDPYDPVIGYKEPIVCACEADHDGALTMQILKMVSGGQPTSLMDVRFKSEEGLLVLANCGASASFFAAKSVEARDNWKRVSLMPNVFGLAGGFTTQYVYEPGKATLARLCQKDGQYWMAIIGGDFVYPEEDDTVEFVKPFPCAFFKANLDFDELWETYGSNHIHAVYGDFVDVLEDFCTIAGIEAKVYAR